MATVLESLQAVNAYPVPVRTIVEFGDSRGLTLSDTATKEVLHGEAFNLAKADVLLWLSHAPNISQGGQNYSFSDEQRVQLRNSAYALYREYGDENDCSIPKPVYGYKGSRL